MGAKAVENVLAMILVVTFEFGNMLWVTEARADHTVYEEQCQFACKVQQTKETACGGLDNIPTWMISVGALTYTTLVVGLAMGATSFWADYRHRQQLFRFQPEAMPARNSNIFCGGPPAGEILSCVGTRHQPARTADTEARHQSAGTADTRDR